MRLALLPVHCVHPKPSPLHDPMPLSRLEGRSSSCLRPALQHLVIQTAESKKENLQQFCTRRNVSLSISISLSLSLPIYLSLYLSISRSIYLSIISILSILSTLSILQSYQSYLSFLSSYQSYLSYPSYPSCLSYQSYLILYI